MVEIDKSIFKDILISQDELLKDLQMLVKKSRHFLKIEESTGNVRLSTDNYSFINAEKIALLLIGKFFAEMLKFVDKSTMTLKEVSISLGIKETTLTWPMGELIRKDLVEKTEEGYKINQYSIPKFLDDLISKYKVEDDSNGK